MLTFSTSPNIEFVQGETYPFSLEFDNTTANLISDIIISSSYFGFTHTLTQNGTKFLYTFTDEETALFEPVDETYDITVNFLDGTVPAIATGLLFICNKRENPPIT